MEAAQEPTAEPLSEARPPRKTSPFALVVLLAAAVVLVAGAAGAAWYLFLRPDDGRTCVTGDTFGPEYTEVPCSDSAAKWVVVGKPPIDEQEIGRLRGTEGAKLINAACKPYPDTERLLYKAGHGYVLCVKKKPAD